MRTMRPDNDDDDDADEGRRLTVHRYVWSSRTDEPVRADVIASKSPRSLLRIDRGGITRNDMTSRIES